MNPDFDEINAAVLEDNEMSIKLPGAVKTGKKTYSNQGSFYDQGGHSGSSYVYKSCSHPGDKVIFEYKGKQIFASNSSSLKEDSGKWDLIIDLAGVARIPDAGSFIGAGPKGYSAALKPFLNLASKVKYPELLRLYWNDMGTPPVSLQFWDKLWDLLPAKTVICCVGGHGRTGTCIASLMISAGTDYYTAVAHVRTEHCEKAIESLGQEKYLHEIYCDYLRVQMEDALKRGMDAEVEDFKADLIYAAEHKPTADSSFGEKKSSKPGQTASKGWTTTYNGATVGNTDDDDVGLPMSTAGLDLKELHKIVEELGNEVETKIEGGKLFVKECNYQGCKIWQCQILSHQEWIEWDYSFKAYESFV